MILRFKEFRMTLLDEMLAAWRYTRDGIVAEVENLPEYHFMDRPAGLPKTALDLVNHIVESGRLMAGELSRPDGDFRRKPFPELMADHTREGDEAASKTEAVALLRRSYSEGEQQLRAAGEQLLLSPIRQFNGEEATRLVWMHHGVAHEEYHRGQIALYARLLGETPALTKMILGSAQ
jgi:uncharacterized damage-inducible protein DinB